MNGKKFRVGTRKSQLALKQTELFIDSLKERFPMIEYEIVPMSTRGDEILNKALPLIGEKSLFTQELEVALIENKIDAIVHSLKDLPTEITPQTIIGAVLKREIISDVVIFKKDSKYTTLDSIPSGGIIGTSSVRRVALLRRCYPHLVAKSIRGNLNTRLSKLDNGTEYDAIILAAAGVIRLNLEHRINQYLDKNEWPTSVSQGAIAIQCRKYDTESINFVSSINCIITQVMCTAERSFMRNLKGGCCVPVASNSSYTLHDDNLVEIKLKGYIFSLDGSNVVLDEKAKVISSDEKDSLLFESVDMACPNTNVHNLVYQANILGEDVAMKLIQDGGMKYIEHAKLNTQSIKF